MNLKLLMRIYAGLMGLMLLGGVFAPEAMMEGFGMDYTKEVKPVLHFALMGQGLFALITFFISSWMVDDLQKVGPTYAALSLAPVLMNSYHVVSGVVPLSGAFYVENGIWVAFAALFFVFSKK
tara:strand:+ start:371 stop:739 length:369 start_codon:yes stop_codon:yes gene_type:complete